MRFNTKTIDLICDSASDFIEVQGDGILAVKESWASLKDIQEEDSSPMDYAVGAGEKGRFVILFMNMYVQMAKPTERTKTKLPSTLCE